MIIISRAIVWALNCLNYLSLQKSPAPDISVALQNAVCCKFISWASCYSIRTLYYDVLTVCCSAKNAVCCKFISWASCYSICTLYYDALLRQVILVSMNWKISEVDVGGQWVKGLAIFWLGVVA
jgi:hypothetical protein